MIVTFSVKNFRSIDDEQTLSMVASNKLTGSHERHLVPIPGSKDFVLRTSVLYGANGAGKSNLFKALIFFVSLALETRGKDKGMTRDPFKLKEVVSPESTFDIQFIEDDQLYRYGLIFDDKKIVEEWLLLVNGKKEIPVYERFAAEDGRGTVQSKSAKRFGEKVEALITVGAPKEQSFLASLHANLEIKDLPDSIRAAIKWFSGRLSLIRPDSNYLPLGHLLSNNSGFKDFAGEFMKAASIGIDGFDVQKQEISEEQLKLMLRNHIFEKVIEDTSEVGRAIIVPVADDKEVLIEKAGEHHFYLLSIQSKHKQDEENSVLDLDFSEESDGTKRLLNLLPALHQLHTNGGVFVIDEIERSMHPLLIYKFMQFFLSACAGEHRQLIITTHESNLLNQDLLRRDEIWFTEKDKKGRTNLYSLSDFQTRNDLKIDKHYLQGRFGAVPFLANIDRLMENEAEHA